jgi:hypothetical protein
MEDVNGAGHAYFNANWSGALLALVPVGPIEGLPSPRWRPVAVGDFNGDTTEDLLLQHLQTRRLKVCFMAGLAASECSDLVPDNFELGPPYGPSYIVGPR